MGAGIMSTITEQLPGLIEAQRTDGATYDRLLVESTRALRTGDLDLANVLAEQGYKVLGRIRLRSGQIADLLTERERVVHNLANVGAQG
jgi:uncharacterized protein YjfI (DUF2170 family)